MLQSFLHRAAFAVAAVVGLAPFSLQAEDDITYLSPDNPDVVAVVQVADFLASPAFQELLKQLPDVKQKLAEPLGKKTKLTPLDIKSVYIAGNTSGEKEVSVVVTTTKNMEVTDLLVGDDAKAEMIGDYELYVHDDSGISQIDKNQFVMGPPETVRKILKRDDDPTRSKLLEAAWEEVDEEEQLYVVTELGALMKKAGAALPPGFPLTPDTLAKLNTAMVHANADEKVSVAVDVTCADAATATQIKALADLLIGTQVNNPNSPPPVQELLKALKSSVDGETISVKMELTAEATMGLVQMLVPRGAPAPGEAPAPPAPAPK